MSSPNTHCRQPNLANIQEISPYHIISAPQDNGPQRQIYWNSTTQTTQHSGINRKLNSQAETVYNVLSEFGSCSSAGMLGTFISPCNTAQDPPIKERNCEAQQGTWELTSIIDPNSYLFAEITVPAPPKLKRTTSKTQLQQLHQIKPWNSS